MIYETKSGPLELRFEEVTGFVFLVYPPGQIEADSAAIVIEALTRRLAETGEPTFVLVDGRRLTGISSEARKVFGGSAHDAPKSTRTQSYVSAFGGTVVYRTLSNLVIKAAAMLISTQTVMRLDADEAGSRAWLTEQRRAYLARNART
jgi:hypothetical protein